MTAPHPEIWRCEGQGCEGWELSPEDRFCAGCGAWQRPLEWLVEIETASGWVASRAIHPGPARLRLTYHGRSGTLDLSGLRGPSWLEFESPPAQLQPGQSWTSCLRLLQQPPDEGLPGLLQLGESSLEIWCSPQPEARLVWSSALLNPEQSEISGQLEVLKGALDLLSLPPGWRLDEPLPCLLSRRGRSTISLWAPAISGPVQWQLGSTRIESLIVCAWAGQLHAPLRQKWCLTTHPELEIPLSTEQGPVQILTVECSLARVEFPALLEGAGSLVCRAHPQVDEGEGELHIELADGRRQRIVLETSRPPRQPFPGWLLLDLGSCATTAALVEDDGRLTQLPLGLDSAYLPGGIAYYPGGLREFSEQAGPNVVLDVKRNLGRRPFAFEVILPETGEKLSLTPVEVLKDYFDLLWQRLLPQLGLYSIERCCLTHPAAFSPRQVQELRQAFLAAFPAEDVPRLECLSEPLAAAFFFLSQCQRSWPPAIWRMLLYDFGGATSDVAVLSVDSRVNTRVSVEVEHVGGDRWFGGRDITALLRQLLPPEEHPRAEQIKCNFSLTSAPPLQRELDRLVEPRLKLSLPQPLPSPDLLVLSGRASQYPLIGDWLQRQFPGVPLERCPQPKDCVVLGARLQPEVLRSGGPRRMEPGGLWLHFPESRQSHPCSTRLGLKILGPDGTRFVLMVGPGEPLPCRVELTPLALLSGPNPLDVVENLGWDDAYVLPDGSPNTQLVLLHQVTARLPFGPDPASTRLVWELSPDYRLRLSLWQQQDLLWQVGPFELF